MLLAQGSVSVWSWLRSQKLEAESSLFLFRWKSRSKAGLTAMIVLQVRSAASVFFRTYYFLMCMGVFLHLCLCAVCVQRPEEGVRVPGTGLEVVVRWLYRCWELNLVPQEQPFFQGLLTLVTCH